MATIYDLDIQEKEIGHLIGELKDAKNILKSYMAVHKAMAGRECHCSECQQARAWLARNNKRVD